MSINKIIIITYPLITIYVLTLKKGQEPLSFSDNMYYLGDLSNFNTHTALLQAVEHKTPCVWWGKIKTGFTQFVILGPSDFIAIVLQESL